MNEEAPLTVAVFVKSRNPFVVETGVSAGRPLAQSMQLTRRYVADVPL
jgi:hypothetical protein